MSFGDSVFNSLTSHNVDLLRFDASARRRIRAQLILLRDELVLALGGVDFSSVRIQARMESLLEQVDKILRSSYRGSNRILLKDMRDLAAMEQTFAVKSFNDLVKVDIMSAALTPEKLRALAKDANIMGAPAKDWWSRQAARTRNVFATEMRQGFLLGESTGDLIRRVRGTSTGKRMIIELANGSTKSVHVFAGGIMETSTREAEALVRTSVQSVANDIRFRTYQANKDVLKSLQAIVTLDTKTTPICQSHGAIPDEWDIETLEPIGGSNPWTGPPPWHFNCVPGETLVTVPKGVDITAKFKRWYEGEIVRINVSGKYNLTCTKNHPVLTSNGWVPAGLVKKGDDIICCLPQGVPGEVRDFYNAPVRIQDISVPSFCPGGVLTKKVPVSAKDFHGDGKGSKVAIVWSDSLLRFKRNSSFLQQISKLLFSRTNGKFGSLPTFGYFALMVKRIRTACSSFMSGFDLLFSLLLRHFAPLHSFGFGSSTQFDSGFEQSPFYGSIADSYQLVQSIYGIPGSVFIGKVCNINIESFSGHVYNLETKTGWYVANNIVIHNCRSSLLPVTKSFQELQGQNATQKQRRIARKLDNNTPKKTRASMDGQVPKGISFDKWLKRQPASVQLDLLGPTKRKLWQKGKLSLSQMLDQTGRPLSVAQIVAKFG